MDPQKIGALVYLPGEKKIEQYSTEGMELFGELEDYWMKREGLLFYPFDRNKQAFFFGNTAAKEEIKEYEITPNEALSREEYETSVYLAQSEMAEGGLDKVVLARNEILIGNFNAESAFQNAVKKYPSSYGYYVNIGPEKWVGASPELLLHYAEGVLYTMALAGTKLLDESFTPKEREEQAMVCDFIEEKLDQTGLVGYTKSELTEDVFHTIKHLKTTYTVASTAEQALDVLKRLHPTSAVCGLPRDKSFGFIQEYETMNRSFYSGTTGILRKESATFFVNLRCMRFYKDTVELFAGAGITKDSDASAEWEETEKKIGTIKELLG